VINVPAIRIIRAAVPFVMFMFFIASAEAASGPHRKGSFTATFEQYSPLSDTKSISNRMRVSIKEGTDKKHHYDIEHESFEVYVPDCYDSNTPFGLIVWIPASPSGGIEPSQSDINITAQLKAAGAVVGIELLDHIIFNRTGYFSFLEAGKL